MSIWTRFFESYSSSDNNPIPGHEVIPPTPITNPATGLPMIGEGYGGVDVGGSPFGTDIHHHDWTPPSGGSGFDNN